MAMTSPRFKPVSPEPVVLPVDRFGVSLTMLSRMVIMLLALVFGASGALARNVVYEVKSQALSEVIDTLSDLSGMAVVKAGAIPGRLENWKVRAEGLGVFEALARDASLFMAYDGSRVIIASRAHLRTTIVPPGQDWETFRSLARSLYPVMPEDALHYDAKTRTILVRGPASFTDAITGITSRPEGGVVRVIKGGSIEDVSTQSRQ